jgi:hypothetical protein
VRNVLRAGVHSEWQSPSLFFRLHRPHHILRACPWSENGQLGKTRPSSRYTSESTQVLTSNNNERPALHKNETYTTNLAQLDALVFTQERTVSRQDITVRVVLPYLMYINAVLEM